MIPPNRVHPRNWTDIGIGLRVGKAGADETRVSTELWTKFEDHAAYAQYTPFVVALAAGTLKMESLLNYLGQDLYYLEKYIEACAIARDSVDNDEDRQLFQAKIDDTKQYAEEMQQTVSAKASCPNTAAVDYTSFLLATAAGKVEGGKGPSGIWEPVEKTKRPAYSICSITPCSRLYRFLAQQFVDAVDYDENPYTDWIKMIFGTGTSTTPTGTEGMLDILATSLSDEERNSVLTRLYYHALSFEIEFFSAVSLYQRTLVPLLKQGAKSNCRYTVTLSDTVLVSSEVAAKDQIIDKEMVRELKQMRRKMDCSNVDMYIDLVVWKREVIKEALSRLDFICAESIRTDEPNWLTVFNNIESSTQEIGMQHISIYIGKNQNDLEQLREAEIGIMIGANETVKHRGESFGVSIVPLFSGLLKQEIKYAKGYTRWNREPDTLYTVSSLSEICAFLVGSSN